MHIIAAKAVCFKEAMEPGFADYQRQIVANAQRLAAGSRAAGFRLVSGGTDNHLMLVDVFSKGLTGKVAEAALGKAGITVNKNAIPFDQNPPMVASGIRIGTPAVTSRGMREPEMDTIAELIARVLASPDDDGVAGGRAGRSRGACAGSSRCTPSRGADATRPSSRVRRRRPARARRSTGFEPRPGQLEMAEAVAASSPTAACCSPKPGTGTGKTLAYLVPAILSRQRVLVSTGTKNLQEQIFFKDLPVLREALGVPFTATCMKGRGNYLCLHRFEAFRETAPAASDSDGFSRGDEPATNHLRPHHRASGAARPRPAIAPRSRTCPRTCRSGTTSPRRPRTASAPSARATTTASSRGCASAPPNPTSSSSTITCSAPTPRCGRASFGEVIPRCSYAIVDEAHQLEDVATQYFGLAVSNYRVDDLARDVDRAIGAKLIADQRQARRARRRRRAHPAIARATFFARAADASGSSVPGVGGAESRIRVGAVADAARSRDDGAALVRALEALEADIALARGRARGRARARPPRRGDPKTTSRSCCAPTIPASSTSSRSRGRGVFLRASPIDVSAIIRELLLDRMDGDRADLGDADRRRLVRLRRGPARRRRARGAAARLGVRLRARRRSSICRSGCPIRGRREFAAAAAREIVEILKRTRGRAFVLFTSYANLREVHRLAAAELEYPILVQGTAPRSALLRDFKATPNAVLLATSSFWQGVDVVGEALSCVIIDKLPFASPGDPITAARVEAIAARGGSPFGEYQIPLAILALKQGLGRLLRHRQDRGVLAVLDPRLQTMGYGRRFLASLPPAPVTHDLVDIARFFGALAE